LSEIDYHAPVPRLILVSVDGLAHYYWSDPAARMPVLRSLAERGAVADGMATVFVSTTWPSHVSLVTGVGPRVHGVVSNHVLNRTSARPEDFTGDPVYDAADLVWAPTIYDRAHAAGLRTAAIDWPATRRAASLDFNLPFFKSQQVFEAHTAPTVWKELAELGYPVERQGEPTSPSTWCAATRPTSCWCTSSAPTAISISTARAPRKRTGRSRTSTD
jgi:Type I phosphodiesterase / nucleotide pyrophosphatase